MKKIKMIKDGQYDEGFGINRYDIGKEYDVLDSTAAFFINDGAAFNNEDEDPLPKVATRPDVNLELVEALEMIVFEHESCPPAERKMFYIAQQALAKHKADTP